MNTLVAVLYWVADTVEWLLTLDWWLGLAFVPVGAAGWRVWLRPTGKRRRPRARRPVRHTTPLALPAAGPDRDDAPDENPDDDPGKSPDGDPEDNPREDLDDDTIVFQAVTYPRGEADI